MSALQRYRPKWTEEEYLSFERGSNVKHEFIDGEVVAMAGASRVHNLLSGNTFASLHAQLRKRPCQVFQADMRVKFGTTHSYPDVVVVCGTPKMIDDKGDTLLNPTVIIEVLSPTTAQYDRVAKRYEYQKLDSIQDYILIAQDSVHVEHYRRQADKTWQFYETKDINAVIDIPSIECTLSVADIYEKVTFEDDAESQSESP